MISRITGAHAETTAGVLFPKPSHEDDDYRFALPPMPIIYEKVPIEQTRWEHHCLIIDPQREDVPREEELNKLGAEGWALAGVLDQSRSASQPFIYFYFIRPVRNS
jgi:hypothetical protein